MIVGQRVSRKAVGFLRVAARFIEDLFIDVSDLPRHRRVAELLFKTPLPFPAQFGPQVRVSGQFCQGL